jgi:hypothetical protein
MFVEGEVEDEPGAEDEPEAEDDVVLVFFVVVV